MSPTIRKPYELRLKAGAGGKTYARLRGSSRRSAGSRDAVGHAEGVGDAFRRSGCQCRRYGTFVYMPLRLIGRDHDEQYHRQRPAPPPAFPASRLRHRRLVGCCVRRSTRSARRALQETMDIGDEPGRVSTEEVSIADGPYARQMVLFRSNEAPGTVVIHSAERFLYVVQGNGRALRYGIGVGREGFTVVGPGQGQPQGRNGRTGARRRRCCSASPICRASWPAGPATRWARARSISARPSSASTAPTSRRPSARRSRPAASASPMATSSTSTSRVPVGTKVIIRHKASAATAPVASADPRKEQTDHVEGIMDNAAPASRLGGARRPRAFPPRAGTLDTVKQRGTLQCGVSEGVLGFSEQGRAGQLDAASMSISAAPWRLPCSAMRARSTFTPLLGEPALRGAEELARSICWRATRPGRSGARPSSGSPSPASPIMTARASWRSAPLKVDTALALDKAKVCVEAGTTTQLNLADFFKRQFDDL